MSTPAADIIIVSVNMYIFIFKISKGNHPKNYQLHYVNKTNNLKTHIPAIQGHFCHDSFDNVSQ